MSYFDGANQRINVERYKEMYPAGTRIKLLHMSDFNPVPAGTCGTVKFVDDIGTVHCQFDNGRALGMIPGVDEFCKI